MAQGRPPLKLVKKWPMQKGRFESPVSLKTGNKSPMWKVPFLYQEVERHPYPQRWGIQGWEAYRNKLCYFFTNLPPKPKLLSSLLIKHSNLSFFVLSLPLKFILCLKYMKAACFGHFLCPIHMRSLCAGIKLFSPVNLFCNNFIISLPTRTQEE